MDSKPYDTKELAPLLVVFLLTTGCSLTRMLPKGPVVDEKTRRAVWRESEPSGVDYTSPPQVDYPALPFLVFGLRYDLDIVLVSDHPTWEMHEYARLPSPDGPIWLAKDTRASDGNQLLVADREMVEGALPEIPLARRPTGVEVDDRSTDARLDLDIRYENFDGEQVDVHYEGPRPDDELARRNGSTMGHSRHQVLAVLDLPNRTFGTAASMAIGGRRYGIRRALGLQPMRLAIRQTQGGIPQADVEMRPAGVDAFQTTHRLPGGRTMARTWQTHRDADRLIVAESSPLRRLVYRFHVRADGALELSSASVRAYGDDHRTFHIAFSPALPDLRRSFRGTHQSRFVIDVGGQRNHAVGEVRVTSGRRRATVRVRGSEPWWVADRCVDSTLARNGDGRMTMQTTVEPCP